MSATPKKALAKLLMDLFEVDALRREVAGWPDGAAILREIPGAQSAPAGQVAALVDALVDRGLVEGAFFDRLVEVRARRAGEIAVVRAAWGLGSAAQSVEVVAARAKAVGLLRAAARSGIRSAADRYALVWALVAVCWEPERIRVLSGENVADGPPDRMWEEVVRRIDGRGRKGRKGFGELAGLLGNG